MNSKRILTRKTMGLDYRVWRVMILVIILAGGLLSYKLMDKPKCIPVNITIHSKNGNDTSLTTNDKIEFRALSKEKSITWDFKDNSPIQKGVYVEHQFKNDGDYRIKITINACTFEQPVRINKFFQYDSTQIVGNAFSVVGKNVNFKCLKNAGFYEWNVLEHPLEYPTRNGSNTSFKFLQPGTYTIELTLTLNKDSKKKYYKTIKIDPETIKIPEDKNKDQGPLIPRPIFIDDITFAKFFQLLVNNKNEKQESDFDIYSYNMGTTPVIINNKENNPITFSQACKDSKNGGLKGKRIGNFFNDHGIKIETVFLTRDNRGGITLIRINYK